MKISATLLTVAVFAAAATVAAAQPAECDTPIPGVATVFGTADAGYADANHQFASNMGEEAYLDPELIAMCANEEEVVAAVQWANTCNHKVSVRSGGHQYAGYSSCGPWRTNGTYTADGCLTLDVSALEHSAVDVDAQSVTIGVGFELKDVLALLEPYGYVIPMGICDSVGVGGHYQSSAMGWLARAIGVGMDVVTSFRLVTAEAEIVTVTPESDRELFWAVLGGSPGSWGVVLDYTFTPIDQNDYPHSAFVMYVWPFSHDAYVAVADAFLEMNKRPEIARDLTGGLFVQPLPAVGGSYSDHYMILNVMWTGGALGNLTDEHFATYFQPLLDAATPLPYPYSQGVVRAPLNFLMTTFLYVFEFGPNRYHIASKSTFIENGIDSGAYFGPGFSELTASSIEARMEIPGVYSSHQMLVAGSVYGSQLNRNRFYTSYAFRNVVVLIDDWVGFANPADNDAVEGLLSAYMGELDERWPTPIRSASDTFMTTESKDAEQAEMEEQWSKYFPSRLWFKRLQRVKDRVDERDLFSSALTIPISADTRNNNLLEAMGAAGRTL